MMNEAHRPPDLMAELGELALVSRLHRLGDALWEETAALYERLGVDFQPRWFAVFYAIGAGGRPSISELAADVRLTPQAVGNIADELLAAGLIRNTSDPKDSRVRRVVLSRRGRSTRLRLESVWHGIRSVASELMAEAGVDLVKDLDRVEQALRTASLGRRFDAHFGLPAKPELEITDYCPAYKKHFRALNEQWLAAEFAIEKHDAELLADPNRRILRQGGSILFALLKGEVVGTCAVVRHRSSAFELVKMAVDPGHRNRGVGTALAAAAVERAFDLGAQALYVRTHPRLAAARRVYRKVGFRRIRSSPLPPSEVARDALTMRLDAAAHRKFTSQLEES